MALKKLKKGLKKAAKAIVPIGAAVLAAKAMGKKKQKPLRPQYFGGNKTGDASVAENMAKFNKDIDNMAKINSDGRSGTQGGDEQVDYFKKGGRVGVGIAKRGFGRAMKGRK